MALPSLTPQNLRLYKDIGRLLIRYGRSDLVRSAGLEEVLAEEKQAEGAVPDAERLADDLEQLGPTFVKLGQLLSTRSDLLPLPYLEALSRLQDKVEPFPFAEVEAIVESELGVKLRRVFQEFDTAPIAAASLGQVHRAVMRDGRLVAVKVQRPGIRDRIAADLDGLGEIAQLLDDHTDVGARYGLSRLFDEFRRSLVRELDYRQEARNLAQLAANLEPFDRIAVPLPVEGLTTSRVLTMEYVSGRKITAVSPLALLDVDGATLADQLFEAYLHQVLVDGFFHADPHPGNVFITDGGELALIDLGMVAHIPPRLQTLLIQVLLAVAEQRSDEVAELLMRMADRREDFDEPRFTRAVIALVHDHAGSEIASMQVGRVVLELAGESAGAGLRPPPELSMLGRALLNLDQIARLLDPRFDPDEAIRRHSAELIRRWMLKSAAPGNLYSGILEVKEFAERLPGRLNRILDMLASNEMRIHVDALDEQRLLRSLHRVANRLSVALLLSALIIGAALLMRVNTSFQLLGYPGVAIILFLLAAAMGLVLVVSVLRSPEE